MQAHVYRDIYYTFITNCKKFHKFYRKFKIENITLSLINNNSLSLYNSNRKTTKMKIFKLKPIRLAEYKST